MNRKLEYIIRIVLNTFRFLIKRVIHGNHVKNSWKLLVSPKADIYITNGGQIDLGSMCNIEKNTQIRSTGGHISVGNRVYINRNCNIVSHMSINIEDGVTIGPNVCIYDHDHNYKNDGFQDEYVSKGIQIGKGTWIGANCVVTKGVKIGANCVVAAGTIVTKDIPDNMIIHSKVEYAIKRIED